MDILQFPLVRITFFFTAGIVLGSHFPLKPLFLLTAGLVLILAATVQFHFSKRIDSVKFYFATTGYLLAVIIGISTHAIHSIHNDDKNYVLSSENSTDSHTIEIIVREALRDTKANKRYIASVYRIDDREATGKLLLNVRDITQRRFAVGMMLKITGNIVAHQPPMNPGQFDYGRYLSNKSISAQMFVDRSQISASAIHRKDIWYYADRIRSKTIANLAASKLGETELSVLSALILGQQQDISRDVIQHYQYAGAVHILSVSGLHVGFILLFLNFILKRMPKSKSGLLAKLIIIILCLWGFAVIAGFSPSVVRSVTMFSFVAIGMHLKRGTNIFHTLIVSIFLILLFQPSFIYDVGFQLSYTALFFILWLQPLLARLWQPRHTATKYCWDIVTVSFAAQIGTFPLSVYYFHQFPGLFFVTNLVVLPCLGIIMGLGVLATLIALFSAVPPIVISILYWFISTLNTIIKRIASYEDFVWKDIPFNWQMMLAFYLLIISITIWLMKPRYDRMKIVLVSVFIVQIVFLHTRYINQRDSEFVLFNVRKQTLIACRSANEVLLFSNGLETDYTWTLQPFLNSTFSKVSTVSAIPDVLVFNNEKILFVDSMSVYPSNVQPDILILRQSPKINLERFLKDRQPKTIIADGSNYRSYIELWRQTCLKEKIPFHATGEKGFYRISK